ncbi:MAG: zinc ribbon domain-containing protein [Candidatus Micrarchaeota archaeon]
MGLLDSLRKFFGKGKKEEEMLCVKCKVPIPPERTTCPKCGRKVSEMYKVTCPKCGAEIPWNADKCFKCGTSFKPETKTYNVYICPRCGFEAKYYMIECPSCGVKLV